MDETDEKYYLMVKCAMGTGLKYLCYTKNDPYTYKGSGIRWLNHIKKHDSWIVTWVINEYETKEQIKENGLYYSELWNIVESDEWANLRPEEGDGGGGGKIGRRWRIKDTSNMKGPKDRTSDACLAAHKRVSENMKKNNPMKNPETLAKFKNTIKGKRDGEQNPFYGKKHTEETRAKMRGPRKTRSKKASCITCQREFDMCNYGRHVKKCYKEAS